jgi:hypothetical protein
MEPAGCDATVAINPPGAFGRCGQATLGALRRGGADKDGAPGCPGDPRPCAATVMVVLLAGSGPDLPPDLAAGRPADHGGEVDETAGHGIAARPAKEILASERAFRSARSVQVKAPSKTVLV